MLRTLLRLLLLTITVSACAPGMPTPLPTPGIPDLGKTWSISMNQSGGIMGLSRFIQISSDSKFTVRDERTGKSIEGELSAAELSKLSALIMTVKPAPVKGINQAGCADCFIYTIEIRGAGEPFSAQVDDVTLADSGLESLVAFLRDIVEESLQ